jgi:hypothetical protein
LQRASQVLRHLVRQPVWLVGTCISALAVVMHAFALRLGSIALVQPLMLVGVVLAVPARSALEGVLPRWSEVRAVSVTAAGLAVFLLAVSPRPSGRPPRVVTGAVFVTVCFAVGLVALRASRRGPGRSAGFRAGVLGAGAGVMFGVTAGLLKAVGGAFGGEGHDVRRTGATVVLLVAAGVFGTAMNQKAYHIAPISFSLPLVNVVDLAVAVVFGALVFGEVPGHGVTPLVVEALALGCIGLGLRLISSLTPAAATSASV